MNKKGEGQLPMGLSPILIAAVAIIIVLVLIVLWYFGTYNALVTSGINVDEKWANIQSAYQRRFDLIPQSVAVVEAAAKNEQSILTKVTALRTQADDLKSQVEQQLKSAAAPEDQMKIYDQAYANMNAIRSQLNLTVEAYPTITSTVAFTNLQTEIEGTENRILYARNQYNESVKQFNTLKNVIPNNIVAGMMNLKDRKSFEAASGSEVRPNIQIKID